MEVKILDKYRIKNPSISMRLGCLLGFHFDTMADRYKIDGKVVNKREINSRVDRLRLSARRCGNDLMYCRVCGKEWREKWKAF